MKEIFRAYFYDSKKNRGRSVGSTVTFIILFVVLMVGFVGGIFTMLSVAMCAPMMYVGAGWLYFAIMGLVGVLLGAFGSVFNTFSGLYLAKDNDLLLSMPIPVGYIMASRLLSVYLMGLMYSGTVTIPAVIVYFVTTDVGAAQIVCALLFVLLVSLIVLLLSCLLGYVVARISSKLKNKSFITVIVSLVFIAAYYFFYSRAQSIISVLIENVLAWSEKIRGYAYPLYFFGRAGEGSLTASLVCFAVVLALLAVTWIVMSKSFIKTASMASEASGGKKKADADAKGDVRVRSMSSALFMKEIRRFTSSANYMLNCGLGTLLLPLLGVYLIFKANGLNEALNDAFGASGNGIKVVVAAAAACLAASMNDISAPSVSLEGKNIWILQSFPVLPEKILFAKVKAHIALTLPSAIVCSVCTSIAFGLSAAEGIVSALTVSAYVVMLAAAGVWLNLKMPNLKWTNELAPLKQSAPVMLIVFGGWIISAAFGGIYFIVAQNVSALLYILAFTIIFGGVDALLIAWLRKKGAKIFAEL